MLLPLTKLSIYTKFSGRYRQNLSRVVRANTARLAKRDKRMSQASIMLVFSFTSLTLPIYVGIEGAWTY